MNILRNICICISIIDIYYQLHHYSSYSIKIYSLSIRDYQMEMFLGGVSHLWRSQNSSTILDVSMSLILSRNTLGIIFIPLIALSWISENLRKHKQLCISQENEHLYHTLPQRKFYYPVLNSWMRRSRKGIVTVPL